MAIFISSLLIIITLIHSFIYASLTAFFPAYSLHHKRLIILVLFFLSIGFFIASIFSHISYNFFTRFFYGFSTLWYGLAIYLVMISVVLWAVKAILAFVPNIPHQTIVSYLAIALYSMAGVAALFGLINAFNVQTTKVTVRIKNLPSHWQGKTIVQISDLHLGGFWGRPFLQKIVNEVNQLNPDIIAITGDLFDGASARHEKYIDVLKQFDAKKTKVYISGNHEVYSNWRSASSTVTKAGFLDLDNKTVDVDGLKIVGIGSPRLSAKQADLVDIIDELKRESHLPVVLLYHTPTDFIGKSGSALASHSTSYLAPDTAFVHARKLGISLQLSGHTHAGQFFPFTWLTRRIYRDYHYGHHRIDDFNIYISSGTGTWGPPMRIGCSSEIAEITLSQ